MRMEFELRECQRRLRDLLDFAPDATFAVDLDGRVTLWNKAMERMTGRKARDMMGKGNHEYAIPFYGKRRPGIIELLLKPEKRFERTYSNFRRTREGITAEIFFPGLRGRETYLWLIARPLYSPKGRVVGAIEGLRDITEHKKAQAALKASEEKYHSLVDHSLQGIVIAYGPAPRLVYANPAIARMVGYTTRELTGLSPLQLVGLIHPEDRKKFFELFDARLAGKRVNPHHTVRVIRKGGRTIWLDITSNLISYEGKTALQGTFIDVTEQKMAEDALGESEETFRSVIEASHDLIMLTQVDGIVTYLSPACRQVIGWKPESLVGTRPDIVHPEDAARVRAGIGQAQLGKSGVDMQYRIITQDGRIRWVSHSWSPLQLPGKLKMVASVVQDITERRKTEEGLIRQKEQIEELSKMRERFMADITHELKTPLSVILLNLEMARKLEPRSQKKQLQECFELMWRNSMRLSRSVDQIMQLTKLESVDVSAVRFRISNMMCMVCNEYLPLAKSKGIEFEMNGPPIEMKGNQHLLAMAVSNLVSNALKFTSAGKVSVKWAESGGNVVISVSDTGIGVRRESQRKIFDKFFKEDHDAPGSGIGLAISSEIIGRMGGRMEFDSVPGKGSTFRIIIPKEVRK